MREQILLDACHSEWKAIVQKALETVDSTYLQEVLRDRTCLPEPQNMCAAFSVPLSQTRYILLGESPYPRASSANGYAFWDQSVGSLWSASGLSKEVNKATSLRNLIKALLVSRGDLESNLSQQSIAHVDKSRLVQTAADLFGNLMQRGILLLNASLVYSDGKVPYHARHWKPFMGSLIKQLSQVKPDVQLILFGAIAKGVPQEQLAIGLLAEHPYNISFISNQQVLDFFKPLDLLNDAH
ncbi:MAG: uracil-DNA glycosylase family protein [Legionellales bacterium]